MYPGSPLSEMAVVVGESQDDPQNFQNDKKGVSQNDRARKKRKKQKKSKAR